MLDCITSNINLISRDCDVTKPLLWMGVTSLCLVSKSHVEGFNQAKNNNESKNVEVGCFESVFLVFSVLITKHQSIYLKKNF